MNVQLENLPNCITTMRVEVPSDKVTKLREVITGEYAQYAKLPGYRPGKAPRAVVQAKYKKEIREELEKRALSDSCREAISENKLRVLSVSNVEDVEFTPEDGFKFTATLVTAPVFDLPHYKNITVQLPSGEVTEQDLTEGLDRLRDQAADFADVTDRTVAMDDFAVITYKGTIDGKPVNEAVPGAHEMLSEKADFWIKLTADAFLPGFSEPLVGAAVGETREFDVTVPENFPMKDLVGKPIHYSVTLNSIKEKVLPELNDAFASTLVEGKTLEEIRELVRKDLATQKTQERERQKREQIMKDLLGVVECELPENMVRSETQRVLEELIRENKTRGLSDEVIRGSIQELIASAGENARDRLKGTFILRRIAEAEKISVSRKEFEHRIMIMGMRYSMTPEKMRKELEKAEMLDQVADEVLTAKVLDFLASSVSVAEGVPAAS
ncbi:MAG: trigger factor [Verrucomicrobiota bacterium]